jgi:hypothetical protein
MGDVTNEGTTREREREKETLMQETRNTSKTVARLLGLVVALQAITILGLWVTPNWTSTAQAQIPDAGAQRNQMIDELRTLNGKMDKLMAILEGGKIQVRSEPADAKK